MRLHAAALSLSLSLGAATAIAQVGVESGLPHRLADGEEYSIKLKDLVDHGRDVFTARWTVTDGFGRPMTKGTGAALADGADPLVFPRNMNRISGPDANSCAGCHNQPAAGGGGEFVANVFVLGQRFDFATFDDTLDAMTTKGTSDETGSHVDLQEIANPRATPGMFGSGYIEMIARQITVDLQEIRDGLALGASAPLSSKGLSFGTLTRNGDDSWDTSAVEGLPPSSLASDVGSPPSLLLLPFHQVGAVVSLRQFTNNAMNHHHGIQTVERFGTGTDPDGDGVMDELSVADVTAVSVFQATLPVPVRVIPNNDAVEQAVLLGEQRFIDIGCAACHVPCLPLEDDGWVFSEPNPFNPVGNLRVADVEAPLAVNLNSKKLPRPRLKKKAGVTWVPAFSDFKLHDITSGPGDPNREALDQHETPGTAEFLAGNGAFLTRELWGCASQPPYFHHGQFSTLREAVEAHAGEAASSKAAWDGLTDGERDAVIEFLKTLRIVPGAKAPVISPKGKKKNWPPFPYDCSQHLDQGGG